MTPREDAVGGGANGGVGLECTWVEGWREQGDEFRGAVEKRLGGEDSFLNLLVVGSFAFSGHGLLLYRWERDVRLCFVLVLERANVAVCEIFGAFSAVDVSGRLDVSASIEQNGVAI